MKLIRWGVCAAMLSGGVALAQDDYRPVEDRDIRVRVEDKNDDKGPYVLLGGGAEGYTGKLAPNLNPGVAYGVHAGIRPLNGLGLELGYNGGLHDVDVGPGGLRDGADIARNAGQAAAIIDVPLGNIKPYAMGGIGIENHNVRGAEGVAAGGFRDDTSAFVPTGVGLRLNLTDTITADARATYNIPLGQDFAPFDTGAGSGRYQGLLQLGGTY